MHDRTPDLRSIPQFLRRPKERAPEKLEIRPRTGAEFPRSRPALPDPHKVIHGGVAPVRPDFLDSLLGETPKAQPAPEQATFEAASDLASNLEPGAVPAVPRPRRRGLPWLARKTNGAVVPQNGVVDLTAHRDAARATPPHGPHEGLHGGLHGGLPGGLPGGLLADPNADAAPHGDEDLAFQVTLPRSVIRQIRLLAAEDATTQRAIILRALRAAGLMIPEGADVDRRAAAARRRQQA